MYYHYDEKTKEFLFESLEKIKDFPATKIDINFNLQKNRNQIFDGEKWLVVYDYRKENIYKKDTILRIYKSLGENLKEDEEIHEENYTPNIKNQNIEEEKKMFFKLKINGFLGSTDKYFNNHPPLYKGDIEKLKKYRNYLYQFTEEKEWWKKELIEFNEWQLIG